MTLISYLHIGRTKIRKGNLVTGIDGNPNIRKALGQNIRDPIELSLAMPPLGFLRLPMGSASSILR